MPLRSILATAAVALLTTTVQAQSPAGLAHHGRLLDATDVPVNGELPVTFLLYDEPTGGAPLWSEEWVVTFTNGYYAVVLGDPAEGGSLDPAIFDRALYLGVRIGDNGPELEPRQRLASSAYALRAVVADSMVGGSLTDVTITASSLSTRSLSIGNVELFDDQGTWAAPPGFVPFVTGDEAVLVTGDQSIDGALTATRLVATETVGPPLEVYSDALVPLLNAEKVGGLTADELVDRAGLEQTSFRNLVLNGSFERATESGAPFGWNVTGDATATLIAGGAYGETSLQLDDAGAGGALVHEVLTASSAASQAGRRYTASVWARRLAGAGEASLCLSDGAPVAGKTCVSVPGSADWIRTTVGHVLGATPLGLTVSLETSGDASSWIVDGVMVNEGPLAPGWTPHPVEQLGSTGVGEGSLADGAVTTPKLADGAVTAAKLAAGAVESGHLAGSAVTTPALADGAVTSSKLDAEAVTSDKIATGAVGGSQLAAKSVSAGHLDEGAVTAFAIDAGAVGQAALATGAVTTSALASGAVGTEALANNAVTADKLAPNAIQNASLVDGSVTRSKIALEAVDGPRIAASTITGLHLAPLAVGSSALANGAVTTAKLFDGAVTTDKLDAAAVTSAKLAGASVLEAHLTDGSVTTSKVLDLNVTREKIADGAINSGKLASNAVTAGKIASSAVETAKLKDLAVTEAKLANGAVVTSKLLDEAVTEAKLGPGAVTSTKLGPKAVQTNALDDAAVTEEKLGLGAVTTSKLAPNAVTRNQLLDGEVTSSKLATNAVENTKIRDGAVGPTKLADNAVISIKIADKAVLTDKINDLAVTTAKIAGSAVDASKLANSAVTNAKLATDAVTGAKIANKTITGGKLVDGTIGALQLASNAVTNAKIADGAVNDAKLASNAVTNVKIANNAVTGAKIAAGTIDHTKINRANLNADLLDGLNSTQFMRSDANTSTTGKLTAGSIATNGNVTIGTTATNPNKLYVVGGSAHFATNSNAYPFIVSRNYKASNHEEIRVGITDAVATVHYINDEVSSRLDFRMQNTDTEAGGGARASNYVVMSLSANNTDGRVGIGTTSPAEKLHVVGNIRGSTLAGTGNGVVVANANGTLLRKNYWMMKDLQSASRTTAITMLNNTTTVYDLATTKVNVESTNDRIVVNVIGYVYQASNNDECVQYWVTEGTNTSYTMRSGNNGDGSSTNQGGALMSGRFVLVPGATGQRTVILKGKRCNTNGGNQTVPPGTHIVAEVYGK